MINIRYATLDDVEKWEGNLPPLRSYLWVGEDGDEAVGIGGYSILKDGSVLLHITTKDDIQRQNKFALCRIAKVAISSALSRGFSVIVAECDDTIDGAEKLLKWLGFEKRGPLYVYKGV